MSSGVCKERSDCTHVQTDLAEHSPLNKFMVTNGRIRVNPFPDKPWFYVSAEQVFSKALLKKVKLIVISNFSFSQSVFCPFGELAAIFIKFEIVVCKLLLFGRVRN